MNATETIENLEAEIVSVKRLLDRDASYQPGMSGRAPLMLALATLYQALELARIRGLVELAITADGYLRTMPLP